MFTRYLHVAVGDAAKRPAGALVSEQENVPDPKPAPVTATGVPETPLLGLRVMTGITVKGALTESLPGSPVTIMV
jgi:hypothetical protein